MSFIESVKEAKTGMTFTPLVFLPMLPMSKSEANSFIKGHIKINPICANWKEIKEQLCNRYPNHELHLSDLYTLGFSMLPLVYEKHKFIRPDRRLSKIGEYTVVIIRPDYFTQVFSDAVSWRFPNLRYPEISAAQYRKSQSSIENYDIYEKPWNERWKKEFLFTARISSNLSMSSKEFEPEELNLGDLSKVAVCVKTEELIKGNFPQEIQEAYLIQYLDSFSTPLQGIQGWCFSVTAEVMDIVPTNKWITKFRQVLPESDWVVNTVIEKLRPDTQGLPRMVFHHKNGQDHIHIGINRITFTYSSMKEVVFDEIDGVLELIDSILPKKTDWLNKFCLMSVMTNANLGTVRELWATKKNAFLQQFVQIENDLIVTRRLETDLCMRRTVLGINAAQLAWHYTVTTSIPNDETYPYYSADDVKSYFNEIATKHVEEINKLMKGKIYDRYCKMQKHC